MCKIYTKDQSQKLEDRLNQFCEENNIDFKNEINITQICKKLNIENCAIPMDNIGLDGVIIINNSFRVIAINENLDVQDARFAIAHELAHYITQVHSSNSSVIFAEKDKIFHGERKKKEENDMDYLAAAMLIPKDQFINELKNFNIPLENFKDKTIADIKQNIQSIFIDFFVKRYNVKEAVIIRRIAEVSYYAE